MGGLDPLIAFFVFGVVARAARSELALPAALTDTLAILLLMSIGLKGGIALADRSSMSLVLPAIAVVVMGSVLAFVAYALVRGLVRLDSTQSAILAGHFGSVSVGTFAIASAAYSRIEVTVEPELALYAVLLEAPAILVAMWLVRRGRSASGPTVRLASVLREILLGKSVVLLLGGLVLGVVLGSEGIASVSPLFIDGFRVMLALFLLGLGLTCGEQLSSLRGIGARLVIFAVVMPLVGAVAGLALGHLLGLSVGGTAMMATLGASASYIAAPAAFRVAIPDANLAPALVASLGVTFPYNVVFGIWLYLEAARWLRA